MSVSFVAGDTDFLVGSADFLHSFFSTVAVRAEDGAWGSRFPTVMEDLYAGRIPAAKLSPALDELIRITAALVKWPPDAVVWDADDRSKRPPWGSDIAPSITNLANYFVTADGRDLLSVLGEAIESAGARQVDLTIA
jgi:2,3-bisphosphoglycerate-dependent phosphoglycerate mutase